MRQVLRTVGTPDHAGLAYDAWAPVGDDGKVPDDRRTEWLSALATLAVAPDYSRSFQRWKTSFSAPGDRVFELVSRVGCLSDTGTRARSTSASLSIMRGAYR
jgi:CRISPR-associated protein Cmr6